jgi:pyridoxamine 5'-phosphate oxidase
MEILRGQDPILLFQEWLEAARETEPFDAEAMALATVSPEGAPSVRMVLLKAVGPEGFTFHTNMESRKGREIAATPQVALCFHWKTQHRQVRVEGVAERVSDAVSDAYFKTRPVLGRLGAWASEQSQPLESRMVLEGRVARFKREFEGREIPRPPHWSGFRIAPQKIEFWQEGEGRLHDRFLFTRAVEGWDVQRLNP